ncbi:MAG: hypothetical protein WKG07_43370 [Hymenobacter sp.]
MQSPYAGAVSGVPARGRFSPTLFKGTFFSTGGYSAEYGQALSAVVNLNSVDLAPETQTGISLLSVGGSLRTRALDRTSVSANVDYTNLAPISASPRPTSAGRRRRAVRGGALRLATAAAGTGC